MSGAEKSRPRQLRQRRRPRRHGCWGHLIAAPLWVAYQANLGTLLRTCDAVGACLAVPATPHYRQALARGDTLRRRSCIHWVTSSKARWIRDERQRGSRILAVELAEDATRLSELAPARGRTVVLLGHEHDGVPRHGRGARRRGGGDPHDRDGPQPQRGRGRVAGPLPAGRVVLTGEAQARPGRAAGRPEGVESRAWVTTA